MRVLISKDRNNVMALYALCVIGKDKWFFVAKRDDDTLIISRGSYSLKGHYNSTKPDPGMWRLWTGPDSWKYIHFILHGILLFPLDKQYKILV